MDCVALSQYRQGLTCMKEFHRLWRDSPYTMLTPRGHYIPDLLLFPQWEMKRHCALTSSQCLSQYHCSPSLQGDVCPLIWSRFQTCAGPWDGWDRRRKRLCPHLGVYLSCQLVSTKAARDLQCLGQRGTAAGGRAAFSPQHLTLGFGGVGWRGLGDIQQLYRLAIFSEFKEN